MSKPDRKYFLAGGESERKVRDFFRRRQDGFREANAIADEVGGSGAAVGYGVAGIVFEGEVPKGWARKGTTKDGAAYFLPVRRSKAGKALFSRIREVRVPEARDLHSQLCQHREAVTGPGVHGGIAIHYVSAEIVGDRAVISVPDQMDFTPPDSKPLKMSEYWALKEEQDA